jgi:hypothetical protein
VYSLASIRANLVERQTDEIRPLLEAKYGPLNDKNDSVESATTKIVLQFQYANPVIRNPGYEIPVYELSFIDKALNGAVIELETYKERQESRRFENQLKKMREQQEQAKHNALEDF